MLGRAMRIALLSICLTVTACAYPRRDTHVIPAPRANVTTSARPSDLWTLRILEAELPPRKPSGLPWDSDGLPDPFVRLLVNGQQVFQTETIENSINPSWNVVFPANISIPRGAEFRVEVWDQDTRISADPMGAAVGRGLPRGIVPNTASRITLNNLATLIVTVTAPTPHRGVGLSVEIHPDALLIAGVTPRSPASRAKLKEGERILVIGGATVTELTDNDAFSRLSLALDKKTTLVVAGTNGTQRTVTLDGAPLWKTL